MILEEDVGERFDKLLAKKYGEHSRTYFQNLIEKGLVLVNGQKIKKSSVARLGDEFEVFFQASEEITLSAENIPLDIVFEDDHILAINKPSGMVVHPACGNWSHTFVNALLFHCQNLPKIGLRPGIVHRLDKETSGLLLAAKHPIAQEKLISLFQKRAIEKKYLAICIGKPLEGPFSAPIGRHKIKRQEMTVTQFGKEAHSIFQTIAYTAPLSFVMAKILTGRTHQIRVHLKELSCPVLGDSVYGNKRVNEEFNIKRCLLHSYQLKFLHPITGKELNLKASMPQDMQEIASKNISSLNKMNLTNF